MQFSLFLFIYLCQDPVTNFTFNFFDTCNAYFLYTENSQMELIRGSIKNQIDKGIGVNETLSILIPFDFANVVFLEKKLWSIFPQDS